METPRRTRAEPQQESTQLYGRRRFEQFERRPTDSGRTDDRPKQQPARQRQEVIRCESDSGLGSDGKSLYFDV